MNVLDGAMALDRKRASGVSSKEVVATLENQMNDAIAQACERREQAVRQEMHAEHARMMAEMEKMQRELASERAARIAAEGKAATEAAARMKAEADAAAEAKMRRAAEAAAHEQMTARSVFEHDEETHHPVAYHIDINRGSDGLMRSLEVTPKA